jgi:hypothetical protein
MKYIMLKTDLPLIIPIFPLQNALLLPRGELPLHIFESRYVRMIEDVLQTSHRMLGIIQPLKNPSNSNQTQQPVSLYQTGCAGRITQLQETSDGCYDIVLSGISRFQIWDELKPNTPYRQIKPDWSMFPQDLEPIECLKLDRTHLISLLQAYFELNEMQCEFSQFDGINDERLITLLCMVCPLNAREKQALLETNGCIDRAHLFMSIIEMAIKCVSKIH